MAAAIPLAIGAGSSIIGGIQGKGAAKRQQQLAQQQLAQLQPLINAQISASQFGLNQAQQLYPQATEKLGNIYDQSLGQFSNLMPQSSSYLTGAQGALKDLTSFYQPFMQGGASAIDRFLPSASRVQQAFAPEFGNINQGYTSASENIAKFAPRGGQRGSTMALLDLNRQNQLSNTFFQGRNQLFQTGLGSAFQGAAGLGSVVDQLKALGLGTGQLGLGFLGQGAGAAGNLGGLAQGAMGLGLQGGQEAASIYNQQANRAFQVQPANTGFGDFGSQLADIFRQPGVQNKIGGFFGNLFGGGKSSGSGAQTGLAGLFGGGGNTGLF